MSLHLQKLLTCQKIPSVFLNRLLSRSCDSLFLLVLFFIFSKNSCRCPLPGVVLLQSLFKTRKHRSAGINCPDYWLIQCSHQNLLHMTTTSNGQISVCLFLRVGIYAADLALFTSHSQDFQNYLNCSQEITPISILSFQSCQLSLLTTLQKDNDWKRCDMFDGHP